MRRWEHHVQELLRSHVGEYGDELASLTVLDSSLSTIIKFVLAFS